MSEVTLNVAGGSNEAPAYVSPVVTSYSSAEILEQVGPALTCSGSDIVG